MATDVSGLAGLAGRYASALFELAAEDKAIDGVAADLAALGDMLVESHDLRRLVRSPVLTRAEHNPAARKRFLREGQLAAQLSHPHTVYIYGTEEINGTERGFHSIRAGAGLHVSPGHWGFGALGAEGQHGCRDVLRR